jgi:serine/threonine-protein kinase RsbW
MIQAEPIDHMKLTSTIESLYKIEGFIARFYGNKEHIEDCYGNILIALSEGVSNAVVHGNQNDPTKMVHLSMEVVENKVLFTIKDEGKGFNLKAVPDPTLPENREKVNGRGIFLMKNLTDSISFEDNGSKVKLTFTFLNR